MVSLYVKFLLLVAAFICVSLSLHWVSWKLSRNYEYIMKGHHVPTEKLLKGPQLLKKPCIGEHCILTRRTTQDVTSRFNDGTIATSSISKRRFSVNTVIKISKLYEKIEHKIVQELKVHKLQKLNPSQKNKTVKSTNSPIVKQKLPVQKLGIQNGELNITSKKGIQVMDEGRVGIWNTESGKDRILEQMAYIPKHKLGRPKGILVDGGSGNWGLKMGDQTFKEHKCRIQNCEILNSGHSGNSVDAVLFGQMMSNLNHYLTEYRKPHIIWLFFALESPMATMDFSSFKNYINWTATYRTDSTIVAPYEKWVYHKNATIPKSPKHNYAEGKSKMAAIFVSNCAGSNERMYYVYDLQKNISVDVFGFCGPNKCPRHSDECNKMLNRDYKFYLAFENANCKDYISEKFFVNALQHDVVPVVMGAKREQYEKVAPKNSFIHVEDFKSPEELAKYLKKLDENDDLYNEYFKWKGTGGFLNTKFWCRLCALLNEDNKPELSVNLEEWWREPNICTRNRWDKIEEENKN